MRLALVEWGDAWGGNSWGEIETTDATPAIVETIGWIAKNDKTGVLIVSSKSGGMSPLKQFVPRGMIQRVTWIGKRYDRD